MSRRIRRDAAWVEGRGGYVRVARKDYDCDSPHCNRSDSIPEYGIPKGSVYVQLGHGLRFCPNHAPITPSDIVEEP